MGTSYPVVLEEVHVTASLVVLQVFTVWSGKIRYYIFSNFLPTREYYKKFRLIFQIENIYYSCNGDGGGIELSTALTKDDEYTGGCSIKRENSR